MKIFWKGGSAILSKLAVIYDDRQFFAPLSLPLLNDKTFDYPFDNQAFAWFYSLSQRVLN
jgi:hypothetical protein